MSKYIDVLDSPVRANPPSKLVTDNRGSKYDIFFETALNNPNEWFMVASAPVSARQTVIWSGLTSETHGPYGSETKKRAIEEASKATGIAVDQIYNYKN